MVQRHEHDPRIAQVNIIRFGWQPTAESVTGTVVVALLVFLLPGAMYFLLPSIMLAGLSVSLLTQVYTRANPDEESALYDLTRRGLYVGLACFPIWIVTLLLTR